MEATRSQCFLQVSGTLELPTACESALKSGKGKSRGPRGSAAGPVVGSRRVGGRAWPAPASRSPAPRLQEAGR